LEERARRDLCRDSQDLFLKTLSPFARRKVDDMISELKAHSSTVKPILVQPSEEESAEFDNPIRVQPKKGMQRKAAPAPQLSEEESAEFYTPIRVQPKVGMQRKATLAAQLPPISGRPRVAGVGIDFVIDSADRLVIESLTPGGPAERKRTLAQGDVLISIDAFELVGQRLSFDDVLDMLRGEEGSDVILGFERPGKSDNHCPRYMSHSLHCCKHHTSTSLVAV
jgi:hypothetical protein